MIFNAIFLGLILYLIAIAWPFVLGALVLLIIWKVLITIKDWIDTFLWNLDQEKRERAKTPEQIEKEKIWQEHLSHGYDAEIADCPHCYSYEKASAKFSLLQKH